jgi:hypothetical protein
LCYDYCSLSRQGDNQERQGCVREGKVNREWTRIGANKRRAVQIKSAFLSAVLVLALFA